MRERNRRRKKRSPFATISVIKISRESSERFVLVKTEQIGTSISVTWEPDGILRTTGPESVQHNPQEPVAAVEAQPTRRVLLANRELVAKREDLRVQGSTGSKTGGYQSEKGGKHNPIQQPRWRV